LGIWEFGNLGIMKRNF